MLRILGPTCLAPSYVMASCQERQAKVATGCCQHIPVITQLLEKRYDSERSLSLSMPAALESWLSDFGWVRSRL